MIDVSWGIPAEPKREKTVSPRQKMIEVIHQTAERHGFTMHELIRAGRGPEPVANARQEAYYLCHLHTGLPYATIGQMFSGRDHTTVMHGIQAHQKRAGVNHGAT